MASLSPILRRSVSSCLGLLLAGTASAQTVEFSAASQTVAETAESTTATVVLSQTVGQNVEVTLVLSGTAAAGSDYVVSPNPVVINQGNLSADVTITLTDDALFEIDESIVLTLTSPMGAGLGTTLTHTAMLQSEDPMPGVEFERFRSLANEGGAPVPVSVVLTDPAGVDVSVTYETRGRAQSGVDYTATPDPLVIPAGASGANIVITIFDDSIRENPEILRLNLLSADHATLTLPTQHNMAIVDNDPVTPGIAVRPVKADEASIDFPGPVRIGDVSSPRRVVFNNPNFVDVVVNNLNYDGDGADFSYQIVGGPLPRVLEPGELLVVDLTLSPQHGGLRLADFVVRQSPHPARPRRVAVSGRAIGPTGAELLLNAAGSNDFLDAGLETWVGDYDFSPGTGVATAPTADISGTADDDLYLVSRVGPDFSYALALPNGDYEVTLRFAEPQTVTPGVRVFDALVEDVLEIDDLDLAASVGRWVALDIPIATTVADGMLDIQFTASAGNALVSAIAIRSVPVVDLSPFVLDFVTVEQGMFVDQTLSLANSGLHTALVDKVSLTATIGSGADFSIDVGGQSYAGDEKSVSYQISESIDPGAQLDLDVTFAPTVHDDHVVTVRFEGNFPPLEATLLGTGGANASWGYLHPVLDAYPPLAVDYDGTGGESVIILGSESHTHEPGHVLAGYEWKLDGVPFATQNDTRRNLLIGDNTISLTITDDNDPANTATDTRVYSVYPGDGVPGVLTSYFDVVDPVAALDSVPALVNFMERRPSFDVPDVLGKIGGSPYLASVMVRLEAKFDVGSAANYEFAVTGGSSNRIEVNGSPVTGPLALGVGEHDLEVRVAVLTLGDLPVGLDVLIDSVPAPGFDSDLVHDELGIAPVIHDMPSIGNDIGGNLISISGFGFYPLAQVTVHWGGQDFIDEDFVTYSADLIELLSPPGSGQVNVTVQTPAGTTPARTYTYSPTGPVPIDFDRLDANQVAASGVTTGEWGPDGRFYVGLISGEIKAIAFDENYVATDIQTYVGVSNLTNHDVLSIAFNPWDPPTPVKVYVGHGKHFVNGGGTFAGPSPYTGQVSVLTGPSFNTPVALVEKLPTSNHDHGIMGIVFDDNGDMLICVGGNTNAGVQAPLFGGLPESPLSGAIVRAEISRLDFNGDLNYQDRNTMAIVNDQVFGEDVDLAPGAHVSTHAVGLRNPYDICLTTWGYLYATDNGPNVNFGPASTGPSSQSADPGASDELVLVEYDNYYGHANRNRGFYDPRQYIYRGTSQPNIPGAFTQRIADVQSSTNGIVEYRSTSFNEQMRGQLIIQKWNFRQRRVKLSADKRSVDEVSDIFPQAGGLDVTIGPGGAMLAMNYSGNKVEIMVPDDASIVGLKALDIFPWRAPSGGGHPFVIGGEGFGTLGNTTVTIGGIPATLTEVTTRRIKGIVPASPSATDLVDVVVNVGANPTTLTAAFKYLAPAPGQGTGFWTSGADIPNPVGEVSAAAIDGTLFLVGEGSSQTYGYDILSDSWVTNLAQRPSVGNHHGSEVVDGKWYLIGGLGAGGGGVQIYDPVGNSWSSGAPMSWSGGSVATAVHDGNIYAFGGIVGSSTVVNAAVYDPVGDSWTALASMPTGVNHAAAASDGDKIYVFGGRGGNNSPQPGFTVVQAFDPVAGTWDSSDMGGSVLTAMPSGRGGAGNAVYIRGEFYVFGGETDDAGDPEATANRVFPDVFAYDPTDHTWRQDKDMVTPRHGSYPVEFDGRIFLAGGGTSYGLSQSPVVEIFNF